MKILFVAQQFPYPPYRDGARLIVYNLLKNLVKNNSIYLITFIESGEKHSLNEISQFCAEVKTVSAKGQKKGRCGRIITLMHDVLSAKRCDDPRMFSEIKNSVERLNPDIIHVDNPFMAQYWRALSKSPRLIAAVDSISLHAYKHMKTSKSFYEKIAWGWLYCQRRWFEGYYFPYYHACTVVSLEDKVAIEKSCPNLDIHVVPNGVDYTYFAPVGVHNDNDSLPHKAGDYVLGFFGNMDFRPNVDAVLYYLQHIHQIIKEKVPGIKIFIVGRNPSELIRAASNGQDIIVTGEVEDMREYYHKVSCVVAPLRSGAGIKNTMLQAMSMAKPIVSTPQAVKAIGVSDGVHVLIAETPHEFADKVVDLLSNRALRTILGQNARNYIVKAYSWESQAEKYMEIYRKVIREQSTRNNFSTV